MNMMAAAMPCSARSITRLQYTVTFIADGVTVKTMTVDDGYQLKDSDYPAVPARRGYAGRWNKYTGAIHEDITITAVYERIIVIPPQPTNPPEIMSVDDFELMALNTPEEELVVTDSAAAVSVPADAGMPAENETALLSTHEGQVLVSTQTVQHDYITQNGKVMRETVRTNGTVTAVMDFIYDESGSPFALKYSTNGGSSFTTYYYVVNLQGDVVKLVTASGTSVAEYTYNAWGEVLTATGEKASINPLRYRGYYYDTETGFYYLQSRYYDPVTHRFINADVYASTELGSALASNMFAYCENNPVNNLDPFGRWTLSFSIGVDFSFFFFGVSASIGIAIDDDSNVAIQWSYSAPNYITNNETYNVGLADVGVGASLQVTDDDTVHDLEGPSCYAGVSAGDGIYGGIDMVYTGYEMMDKDAVDVLPNGMQITIGCGIGIDAHFRQTQTETLFLIK